MSLIAWDEKFSVGVAAVDHEHRELIGLVNDAHDRLMRPGAKAAVPDFLGEIYARISAHFALEEKLMRVEHYAHYGEHKADHERLLDERGVEEVFGVPPARVVEVLALMGDASDNIPGCPGIGEKGARELIQEYGTVENCLASWEQVKRKTYRESLRDNADLIRMSRELVTIRQDLPIELDLDALVLLGLPVAFAIEKLQTKVRLGRLGEGHVEEGGQRGALAKDPREVGLDDLWLIVCRVFH